MKIKNLPQEFVSQAKELGIELVKPASKEGIRKVAIGGAVAGIVSPIYSSAFNYAWDKTGFKNEIVQKALKIGIPFGISAITIATKMPGGNVIGGGLVGVSLVEIGKTIIGAIKGRKTTSTATTEIGIDTPVGLWGAWD